jgi:signal transduction histidine kinase
MRRIEDQRTGRWAGRDGRGPGPDGGEGTTAAGEPAGAGTTLPASGAHRSDHGLAFPAPVRWSVTAAAGAMVVALVALSTGFSDSDADLLLVHAIATVPFAAPSLVATHRVFARCPPEYDVFWRRYFWAVLLGMLAAVAAILAVVTGVRVLVLVDMALILATVPLWVSASFIMVKAHAGRRDWTVDVIDTAMAVTVLTAPGVLVGFEPLRDSDRLVFAIPFALIVLSAPAGVYVSLLNIERIPRGERATQGLGLVLAGLFTANVTLHLARVLGGMDVPVPVLVAVHSCQMALLLLIPVWAHRHATGRLASLAPEEQFRYSNPMPYVSAAVLPAVAVWVFLTRDDRPWSVGYLVAVLVVTVVLNAVRYTVMARETRQLSAELARMAEERRRLLANMVRALEHDRHRTVAELHTQAVGSLATLASIVQAAYVTLPNDTALAVRETIAQLQGDLSERAEELRRLMVAMRPPAFPPTGDDSALGTALLAYASDLYRERSTRTVNVHVDPALELDRSTLTIVYRIAQEALLNAARHSMAETVAVSVTEHEGNVKVEVHDDGVGFDLKAVTCGSGLASMQLFTNLGRGELLVRTSPGRGTLVRSVLGGRPEGGRPGSPRHEPAPAGRGRGHLRLIGPGPGSDEP